MGNKLYVGRVAHYHGIVHMEALVIIAHRFGRIVHGNADDLQALSAILVLQFDETRYLLAAWITPGRPEIQENYSSPVIGELEMSTPQIRQREIGSQRKLRTRSRPFA